MNGSLCDLVESRKDWWSLKNTYLKTSDRLAQEVLRTVGRGIVNDYLACDKKVPEKWFDKKSKLHNEMALDLWRGSNDGNSSSRAINRRYLDIWFGSGIRSWPEVVKYC